VTVRVRGIAASAASLAAMGGDLILVAPAAAMMLHNPASLTFGDSDVHRDVADRLELLSRTYAETYAAESGNRTQDVLAWMTAETWLTAEDAVTLGFADALEETPAPATTPAPTARAAAPALHHQPAAVVATPVCRI
jgi:ATP-dependent protease ClpP protease subunit